MGAYLWINKATAVITNPWTLVILLVILTIVFTVEANKDYNKNEFTQKMLESFESIKVGSNSYKVHEDLINPKLAAETMDSLNTYAHKLIKRLNDKYINDSRGIDTIKSEYRDIVITGIKELTKNFKTANMEENIPERSGGDTSYVIDKGDVFAMCLRDPKKNNIVDVANDMNELKFVLMHELSHLFTSTFGHDKLFWNNFKFVLQEAVELGIYTPVNYKIDKQPYCGIVISYSPLFDRELSDYYIRS